MTNAPTTNEKMYTVYTCDTKDWKKMYHMNRIVTRLTKKYHDYCQLHGEAIQFSRGRFLCNLFASKALKSQIDVDMQEYWDTINAEKNAFQKGIKFTYNQSPINVDFLYNKLQHLFPGQLYLPSEWRGGKSIQTHDQTDFYSFQYVRIEGSKTLPNDRYIQVNTLSGKNWICEWYVILKVDKELMREADYKKLSGGGAVVSEYSGPLRSYVGEVGFTKFEDYLSVVAKHKFTNEEQSQWIKDKKLFILSGLGKK